MENVDKATTFLSRIGNMATKVSMATTKNIKEHANGYILFVLGLIVLFIFLAFYGMGYKPQTTTTRYTLLSMIIMFVVVFLMIYAFVLSVYPVNFAEYPILMLKKMDGMTSSIITSMLYFLPIVIILFFIF